MDLQIIWTFISTFIFLAFFAYIPGKLLCQKAKLPEWIDLNISVGIAVFTIFTFFLRYLLPSKIIAAIFIIIIFFLTKKYKTNLKISKPKINYILFLIMIFGVLFQARDFISSFIYGKQNVELSILSSHDQAWHASLVQELSKNYPPEVPGFTGLRLVNYHYFYDLIISNQFDIFGGSIFYLIQVIYPILISIIFGISVFRAISQLTSKKSFQYLTVFFAYFTNNLSYLYKIITDRIDTLIIFDQPSIFLYNQQTVLSIAVLIYIIIILSSFKEKLFVSKNIIVIILLTFLLNLKIYAYITTTIFLSFLFLIKLITSKIKLSKLQNLLFIGFFSVLISSLIILLNFKFEDKFLHFRSGWIVEEYINRNIHPFFPTITSHINSSIFLNQNLKLFIIKFILGISLILISFNFQILGILVLLKKNNKLLTKYLIACSLIPLFFIFFFFQNKSPYNIIQFAPYTFIILIILTGYLLSLIKNRIIKIIAIVIILVSCLPNSINQIMTNSKSKYNDINNNYIRTLEFVKKQPTGIIISLTPKISWSTNDNRQNKYDAPNILYALSGKNTYFIDETQMEVLNVDYKKRKQELDQIEENFCNFDKIYDNSERYYLVIPSNKYLDRCLEFDQKTIYDKSNYKVEQIN